MKFGVYAEMQAAPGKSHPELIREIMLQIEHADREGFDTYALVDHHFFERFSISSNPLAVFTAAAQRTRNIRFRTALHTLPLENPMRLAGMIAEADILTEGRLECGVGRGHPWLYEASNVPLEQSKPRYEEGLDILLAAWTQERVSYDGRMYRVKDVAVVPKPLQKPHPPIYFGGSSEATYKTAGERGYGILVPPLLPLAALKSPLAIYESACKEHGHAPNVVHIRPVFLVEDEAELRTVGKTALENFIAFNISPLAALAGKEAELVAKGYGFYASDALASLGRLTYDDLIEMGIAFVGTPAQVIRRIEGLSHVNRVGEMAIVSNFGGLEHWRVTRTQELFARKVAPAFRATK